MNNPDLRETLEQLHGELQQTKAVDASSRELLKHLMKDIQDVLDDSSADSQKKYEPLTRRLQESVAHLEDSHPRLTLTIGRVLDNLAAIGL
jgi:ElaB/YqjD/DUF883 family membrane-anchored ribosome-binding protein